MKLRSISRLPQTGSTIGLALGAASLFLFIVGLKRTLRLDEGTEISAGTTAREAQHSEEEQDSLAGA